MVKVKWEAQLGTESGEVAASLVAPWQSTHLPVQDSDIGSRVGRIPRAVG